MDLSILISTFNGEKDIRLLLDSIAEIEKNAYFLEVILRDDCSSDDTSKIVKEEYKWVKVLEDNYGNIGFVKSNNLLFQEAEGKVICCVNQDTILHPRFVVEGMRMINQNPEVAGVNTNMIMPWIMPLDKYRNAESTQLPAYQLTSYGYVRYIEVERQSREANFMTGGGFFVRSAVFPSNYLFDPDIDMYCEDTELSLRLQRHGWKMLYCPEAVIYHNQIRKKATVFRDLIKLIRITKNRFALFARIESPSSYSRRYIKYVLGIINKMKYIGLSFPKNVGAYIAGIVIAVLFLFFFPYWLNYSKKSKKNSILSLIQKV